MCMARIDIDRGRRGKEEIGGIINCCMQHLEYAHIFYVEVAATGMYFSFCSEAAAWEEEDMRGSSGVVKLCFPPSSFTIRASNKPLLRSLLHTELLQHLCHFSSACLANNRSPFFRCGKGRERNTAFDHPGITLPIISSSPAKSLAS